MRYFMVPEGTILKVNGFPYRLVHDTVLEGSTPIDMVLVDGTYVVASNLGAEQNTDRGEENNG